MTHYEHFVRQRITELRLAADISEHRLSLDLGKSGSYIRGITNGSAMPSFREFFNLCDYFNISRDELLSKTRKRQIVQARQIAMYMSRTLINCSLSTIGAEIGGKDHATVLHACTTVNDLMSTDKTFKQYVTDIEKLLVPVRR